MYVVVEEIEEEANPTANLELLQERKKLVLLLCIALCFHKRPDMNKNLDEKPKVGRRLLYTYLYNNIYCSGPQAMHSYLPNTYI